MTSETRAGFETMSVLSQTGLKRRGRLRITDGEQVGRDLAAYNDAMTENETAPGESPPGGESNGYASLWSRPGYLVRRLHQIHIGLFSEECAGFDITPIQFGLLTVLSRGGTFDQVTLSNQVGIDRTSGADVIKRLARRGLVERFASQQDRRAMLVRITDAGKTLIVQMQPLMQAAQNRLLAPLTTEQQHQFTTLMQQVIEANNSASRAPVSTPLARPAADNPPSQSGNS